MTPDERRPDSGDSHSSAASDGYKSAAGKREPVELVGNAAMHKVASDGSLQSHTTASSADPVRGSKAPAGPGAARPLGRTARKKGVAWTEEEHRMFLLGLQKLGRGDWRGISWHFVKTRSPTQVASHAQKHFLRQTSSCKRKKRTSLFDMVVNPGGTAAGDADEQQPARKKAAARAQHDSAGSSDDEQQSAHSAQPPMAHSSRPAQTLPDVATSAATAAMYHQHLAQHQAAAAALAANYGYPYSFASGMAPGSLGMYSLPGLYPTGMGSMTPALLAAAYGAYGGHRAPAPTSSPSLPVAPLQRPSSAVIDAAGDVTTLAHLATLYPWTVPSSSRHGAAAAPPSSASTLHRPLASLPPMPAGLRPLSLHGAQRC